MRPRPKQLRRSAGNFPCKRPDLTMHNTQFIQPIRRFAAVLTLPGRWRLNFHVRLRRLSWLWLVNGANFVKRAFDIAASFVALALLVPLFSLIALFIKIEDGGPAIFTQTRVGKFGRE